jgi:hypothetical protein
VDVDGRSRILTFYPSRHHDGLIRREEYIGNKTVEYFINRDDFMTIRSWHIEQRPASSRDLSVKDVHLDEVVITKMS